VERQSLAIIGDVHGEPAALSEALDAYLGRRTVVLVGDYVNRGRRSAEVLGLLADVFEAPDVTVLMGNHEHAFLQYIATGELAPFARIGGLATINSYIGAVAGDPHTALVAKLPDSHKALLETLHHYYEDDAVFVSHCGVPPSRPSERGVEDIILGSHPELFGPEAGSLPKVVVSGHYAQRGKIPFVSERYICVDSGCGTIPGAPLTVLEWPERRFNFFEVR